MPSVTRITGDRRGVALIFALLMSIAVAAMAMGAIALAGGARLTTRFTAREAGLQAAANGGLEIIRDSINNGNFDSLLPFDNFTTLVTDEPVRDANGNVIPRVTRSLYVGRTGGRTGGAATAGQYGSNFASALSVIRDQRGAVAARRMLMTQESWAKFAVAINEWPGSAYYGCPESINGPFHSNDILRLEGGCSSPKIAFSGPASVVGSVSNSGSGDFQAGLTTGVAEIEWPTPARITLMQQYAQDADAAGGDYDWTSLTDGGATLARGPGLRIEFLTIDADGSGTIEWDEGYMRVWMPKNTSDTSLAYATARRWPSGTTNDPNTRSPNCGGQVRINGTDRWLTAAQIYDSVRFATGGSTTEGTNAVRWVLSRKAKGSRSSTPVENVSPTNVRCYLGGDPALFAATQGTDITPDSIRTDTTGHPMGWWVKRRTGAHSSVAARSDAEYLIPLGANPNFKGVIYVDGDVAISGRVRGRMSIFATGSIVLADDLLYTNAPGTKCDNEGDIFGAIATDNVIISDNTVQTPFRVEGTVYGGFDDTPKDEQYNMFIMAAGTATSGTGNFVTQGINIGSSPGPDYPYSLGTSTGEMCGSAPAGCVRVTGGIAMGRVEWATYRPNVMGYGEAHAYDKCGAVNPPPYFPTTGRFIESRYYELDPVWLADKGIADYFADLRAQ